jgi:hypothetical protein
MAVFRLGLSGGRRRLQRPETRQCAAGAGPHRRRRAARRFDRLPEGDADADLESLLGRQAPAIALLSRRNCSPGFRAALDCWPFPWQMLAFRPGKRILLQSVLIFTFGFLAAALLALMAAPAMWRRAVYLTRKRIEAALPLSINELNAEKDAARRARHGDAAHGDAGERHCANTTRQKDFHRGAEATSCARLEKRLAAREAEGNPPAGRNRIADRARA